MHPEAKTTINGGGAIGLAVMLLGVFGVQNRVVGLTGLAIMAGALGCAAIFNLVLEHPDDAPDANAE